MKQSDIHHTLHLIRLDFVRTSLALRFLDLETLVPDVWTVATL